MRINIFLGLAGNEGMDKKMEAAFCAVRVGVRSEKKE